MVRGGKRFDAERYWASRPLCTVCSSRKVKSGTVCWECKKVIERAGVIVGKEQDIQTKYKMEQNTSNQSSTDIDANEQEVIVTSDFNVPVSPEAQNKIVRLFTYLEKALSLDDVVARDFRNAFIPPSPWWLADYPRDLDNLYIRPFETEQNGNETDSNAAAWVQVRKKDIEAAPPLPNELIDWVPEITPLDKPVALEKIDRKTNFENSDERVKLFAEFRSNYQQGEKLPKALTGWVILAPEKLPDAIKVRYISDRWDEHPELKELLNSYIENDWQPWAERVRKLYKANLLYDQLYALRLLLKNEGDDHELLLGHGLLTWKHQAVGTIYAPIFLTPLTLHFDASKRTIEISPDPMFRSFVEISPVSEMDNPAEIDLDTWMGAINTNPFDFWHFETLKSQANTFLNYLSPDGESNFELTMGSAPTVTEKPSIWNAPVIFVRKRTNSLWSKYAETIRRDIEQNGARSTEFINDLVGEYEEERGVNADGDGATKKEDTQLKEAELLFPLPWNDEQKRIAERLECNYGVVVKGPPGTGKSHTIANLIARFLAQGKSVLVTSQTSKALEVLRDKLPDNIRSLAVSQLQQSAKRDDVLQQSIGEISSNLGERHTKFSEEKAEQVRKELAQTREEKATIANKIRQYILTDSTEKLKVNGDEVTPIEAAKIISEHEEDQSLSWFVDPVQFDTELNFSTDDLKEAYKLLTDLSADNRGLYAYELPDLSTLPNEDVVLGAFAEYRDLSEKAKTANEAQNALTDTLDEETLKEFWGMLIDARKVLASINENYEREIFRVCATSINERKRWKTVLDKISNKLQTIAQNNQIIIGYDISGSVSLPVNDLVDAIHELKDQAANKARLSTFGKILLSANAKKVLEKYRVDGRAPETPGLIEILGASIGILHAGTEIKTILKQAFANLASKPSFGETIDTIQLEVVAKSLKRHVDYFDDFSDIEEVFTKKQQFIGLSYIRLEDIDRATMLISSTVAKFELVKLERTFEEWQELVDDPINNRHAIREKLIQALEKRSSAAWQKGMEELSLLTENKDYAVRLHDVEEKISKYAPSVYKDIVGLADQEHKFDCPDNLALAWKIARLKSWLDHIHNHTSVDDLQNQHERLTKREYQLNSELVTVLAWQRQIDKVTKKQRDALMAWSDAMKNFGKGTGKYANKWLNAAQSSLKEAKNAVPVWIMPLHRAAQMFSDPKAGMFDVVIFDEASQCDIRGLTVGYLGKKLLVVGDPDQISPAGIFQDQERVFELISRFLHDIPHKDNFSITSSLFGLAQIRIPNMIQLNEHFRSVPEIVAFSNHHIYEGKLRPLRHPHPKGLLKPALAPVFVEAGYQNTNNKVNEPEAKEIVEKIAELVEDPNYHLRPDGRLCTFGVISLLAEDQAKYIKELLLKHPKIGEKVIEERNITCGDAYAFQGDERDVMLLSMVKALDPNNPHDTVRPLTDKGAAQRFNVAATRARDQVFLYHSIPVEEFRNPSDWRYRLLNWYYNPMTEELDAGRGALKQEYETGRASQFSFDVGNILIDRGYQVLPEYPVIGYRIDLVVQGENARLAVECDGDQYHTLEHWEADQIRERQLRRAGWEFWRVSGSSFYRHKENALESLWEKLAELGIKPIVGN